MHRKDERQQAVALAYSEGSGSPRVAAKGRGLLADQIIKKAREAGVFVHESPELVSLLLQVDLDQHIPPQLYRAVAELLAFVYLLEHGATPPVPELTALLPKEEDAASVASPQPDDPVSS
ncbi:EscU/YscU/HrcU family type III secretion system export apparatus switch protein [Chitinilyticum litopenaei]|uniref:EscU/YscU/HrcU family type III secretion system export apparatus switch protein n=1 Tax=Chitinilyticum litopenaei TaxID=1121276 RepID=UPI00048D0505|nr:EscU/YscU/HrcU family type III secretion system export apparatus switch protein [Chitinilyticum litopenaei]